MYNKDVKKVQVSSVLFLRLLNIKWSFKDEKKQRKTCAKAYSRNEEDFGFVSWRNSIPES